MIYKSDKNTFCTMVNNYAGKQKSGGERHFFVSVLCPNFISMGLWHSALHIAAAQATGANIHPLHSPYKKKRLNTVMNTVRSPILFFDK